MISKLLNTDTQDIGSFIARVTAGVVMLPHGLQKLAGMFGGYGFGATLDYFASVGIPKIIGFLIISGESFGAIMLIAGLLGRFSAASLLIIMLGAIKVHAPNGFFMNWFGNQKGEGFEFHLLMLGLLLIVAIRGSGKWSVDSVLSPNNKR